MTAWLLCLSLLLWQTPSASAQTSAARADALVAAINAALERPVTDAGRTTAAAKLAELDAMGADVLKQKTAGYSRMVSLNRGSKTPDEKLLRRFLALYDQLPAADREPFRFGRYLVYEILAEQAHRQSAFDQEKALLREGVAKFTGDAGDKRELDITRQLLDRAELVGEVAPALLAEHWLNAAPANNRLDLTGAVTLVEFTAHWCGPCKESYPGLLRFHERFAARGLRIVLATRLWGYFGKEKNLSPERELAADRQMFLDEDKLPFPIAIATTPAGAGPADGADANAKAFFVQPIPQFVLIDAAGIVRRIDLGWDEDYEKALAGQIEALLPRAVRTPTRQTWTIDGVAREGLVVPPPQTSGRGAPLVLVFHGHGGSMQNISRVLPMHTEWPDAVVIYLQGLPAPSALVDPQGKLAGWQNAPGALGDRDLKLTDAVLTWAKATWSIDASRIYAAGHSNGGLFTYVLWATRPSDFAAFAPAAAAFGQFALSQKLVPKPALIIAGEKDTLVPFALQQRNEAFVLRLNQCGPDGAAWADHAKLFTSRAGADVVIDNHPGAHALPADAAALVSRFFQLKR